MTTPLREDPRAYAGDRPTVIVIGLGNRFRQDDAVGLIAARRVRDHVAPSVSVVEHDGDPLDLLPVWSRRDLAILIDALNVPGAAGEIRAFDPEIDLPPDRQMVVSSHGHSLWDAWELAGLLGQRARRTQIFAITGARFDYGEDLSSDVERAVDPLLRRILTTINELA